MTKNGEVFNKRQLAVIFKIAFLEAMALSIILPSVTSTGEVPASNVLSYTYIVKPVALNTYQAFLTQSITVPFFTESNFSRIMNVDIWNSTQCASGCSVNITPGLYNQTQSLCPSQNNLYMTGTSASVITTQKNTTNTQGIFSGCGGGFKSAFYITGSNFTATGFQVDDSLRDFVPGMGSDTGDIFTIPSGVVGTTIQQTTLNHVSSNGINSQGSKVLASQNTISGPVPILKVGGNFGILLGAFTNNAKVFLNTITGFNGSDVAGVSVSQGAHNVTINSNTLSQNEFGILLSRSIGVTINGNTITNNYLGGIVISTVPQGTIHAGPLTLQGNTITNNGFPGMISFSPCASQICAALQIQGSASGGCCWDGIQISGNAIKDTRTVLGQFYDISIQRILVNNQYTNVSITDNTLGITAGGAVINIGAGISLPKSWSITSNTGWNPQPTTLNTAGATPFTYTNSIADKQQVILATVGDMSVFSCSIVGTAIAISIAVGSDSPILNSADSCTFTYTTTAPTFYVVHQ